MTFNSDIHHRRSIRLKDYDYSQAGAYFVTICTWQFECLFGDIVEGEMRLNELGRVVLAEWNRTTENRKEIELDVAVVMPNHFHGIICIVDDRTTVGATGRSPLLKDFQQRVLITLNNYLDELTACHTNYLKISALKQENPDLVLPLPDFTERASKKIRKRPRRNYHEKISAQSVHRRLLRPLGRLRHHYRQRLFPRERCETGIQVAG